MKFTAGHAAFDAAEFISVEDPKEVFAYFGLAIHVANILEHGVANAVFVAKLLPQINEFRNRDEWGAAIDDHFERMFSLTYGNMILELEKTDSFSPTTLSRLRGTKRIRDRLVHHFQREAAELIITPKGREKMILDYRSFIDEFAATDAQLEGEIGPIRSALGATDEWLNNAYESRLRELFEKP